MAIEDQIEVTEKSTWVLITSEDITNVTFENTGKQVLEIRGGTDARPSPY